jgi:hypothetical protein
MGQYSFDTIVRVLQLGAPTSVEASSSDHHSETYPQAATVQFDFPARSDLPPVRLTWYDGGRKPPLPEGMEADRPLAAEGLLFLGDRGTIRCEFNGRRPRLIPEARMAAFKQPPATLPRSPGHLREWLDACRGSKTKPGAAFEFSGPVAETLLLGNVALRVGQRLVWNSANLKVSNTTAAEPYVRPTYRPGWTL